MKPKRVLIVYASTYGQTEKIARRIGDTLQQLGCEVSLLNAKEGGGTLRIDTWDGVIVGASIHARGHQPAVDRFVRANVTGLNRVPSAFFSVSASAGSARPKARAAARRLLERYLARVGWQPALSAAIAGAVNFTRYHPILRAYMRLASWLNGGATDTRRDHEYTDWHQVETFARDFAALLGRVATRETTAGDRSAAPV